MNYISVEEFAFFCSPMTLIMPRNASASSLCVTKFFSFRGKMIPFILILVISALTHQSEAVVERLNAVMIRSQAKQLYLQTKEARKLSPNISNTTVIPLIYSADSVCVFFFFFNIPDSHFEGKREHLDVESKNRICLSIMNSSEYCQSGSGKENLNMYEISYRQLQRYPNTFNKFYEESDSGYRSYVNPTKPVNVYVPGVAEPFQEHVFVCLRQITEEAGKDPFLEYFVSEEYNVGLLNSSDSYIAARFVFSLDDDGHLQVSGIAEEPAKAVLGSVWTENILLLFKPYIMERENTSEILSMNVESVYLTRRGNRKPGTHLQ